MKRKRGQNSTLRYEVSLRMPLLASLFHLLMEHTESDIHPLLFVDCLSHTEGEAKKGFCLLALILIPYGNKIGKKCKMPYAKLCYGI